MYVLDLVHGLETMDGAATLARILADSGMTKSALCGAAGVSRSLFDDYLKGKTQPSLSQLAKITDAVGFRIDIALSKRPLQLPPEFVAVLEFGDLFPRKPRPPLVNLGPTWRQAAERHG